MARGLKRWLRAGTLVAAHPVLFSHRLKYCCQRSIADSLSSFGYYKYPYRIIFIAGMPMSGTTWMMNLLSRIPGYYMRHMPMPLEKTGYRDITDLTFSQVPKHGYTIFKTHLNPSREKLECLFRNGVEKILITHRDIRDVTVSRCHRLMDFPKSRDAFDFVDYRAMGMKKALDHSIELIPVFVSWIREWLDIAREDPGRCHIVKFEDLKRDTKGTFQKALDFYGIKLSDAKINRIIEAAKGRGNVKENMSEAKLRLLPYARISNFRSGKISAWREEFSKAQVERCKELLGPTLIELGYEKDLNWSYGYD